MGLEQVASTGILKKIQAVLAALTEFFIAIKDDHRIGPSHISLYLALLQAWIDNGFKNPVPIRRSALMKTAKISGLATYHKCIKDLAAFGYIEYMPSFDARMKSRVNLVMACKND